MKIIKQGDTTKTIDTKKEFVCKNCNCIFEVDDREYDISTIKWNKNGLPTLSTENVALYRYIFSCKCPNCGSQTYHEEFVKC